MMLQLLSFITWLCVLGQLLLPGTQSLKGVTLQIYPPAVRRGREVVLQCEYDLEGAPLYSVKWYRGTGEIYRYLPSEEPRNKVFPFRGVSVDLSKSNEKQVVLQDVGFSLSGEFSCEVSADAPRFSTLTAYQNLLVVELPKHEPELSVDKHNYISGDTLRANCTSPPSRPPASLTFLLNDIPVGYPDSSIYIENKGYLKSSMQSLTLQLFQNHFEHGPPILKCKASIEGIYSETVEARLSTAREPIPERVMSSTAVFLPKMAFHPLLLSTLAVFVAAR